MLTIGVTLALIFFNLLYVSKQLSKRFFIFLTRSWFSGKSSIEIWIVSSIFLSNSVIVLAKFSTRSGKLAFVVTYIDWIVVFFMYSLAISFISLRANGSPPVKFTFNNDFPKFFVNWSISLRESSPLKVFGSSKSIKQKEHLALHLLVIKWLLPISL